MTFISPGNSALVKGSLGRLQACIDQLVGQVTITMANPLMGIDAYDADVRAKVLTLAQKELHDVGLLTGLWSPAADADGAEWLLRQLRA